MTITSTISARILHLVGQGLSIRESFDEVLGAGAYERMAGELYDALRAKAA